MEELKQLFQELSEDDKRKYMMIGALVLAVLVACLLGFGVYRHSVSVRYQNYMNEAQAFVESEDYEGAISKFEAAYRTKATDEAAIALAQSWASMGDNETAIMIITNRINNHKSTKELEDLLHKYQDDAGLFDNVIIAGNKIPKTSTAIILEDVELTAEDLNLISQFENLVTLSLKNCGLNDIEFLKNCNKLMSVTLTQNNIKDIKPLLGKKDLRTLYLNDNPIEDFTPLYQMQNLTTLNVRGIWITSEQLAELRQKLPNCTIYGGENMVIETYELGGVSFTSDVKELNLSGKGITDISVLRHCTQLERLDLSNNNISYIGALESVRTLKWLNLSNNKIANVSSLDVLTHLTYLDIENNQISNITPLSSLTALTEFYASNNPIYNGHTALTYMTNLTKLSLKNTNLNDNGLDKIPTNALKELDVRNNAGLTGAKVLDMKDRLPSCNIIHDEYVTDVTLGNKSFDRASTTVDASYSSVINISALNQFTNLKHLNLSGNGISNFQPLRDLKGLETLELKSTGLSDPSVLVNQTSVTKMNLADNNLNNVYALSSCVALKDLNLSGNKRLTDVVPLGYCTQLEILRLDHTGVTDLSVLPNLTKLHTLYLDGCAIRDFTQLYRCANLRSLYIIDCGITYEQLQALKNALPSCTIYAGDVPAPQETPTTPPTTSPTTPDTVPPVPDVVPPVSEVVPPKTEVEPAA